MTTPQFPPPRSPSARSSPYREPSPAPARADVPTRAPRATEPDARAGRAAMYAALAAEDEEARRRLRRTGLASLTIGLALCVGGVGGTFASNGRMIFYGAAVAGALGTMRGVGWLVRSYL